jgi:enoyl-CoA hydratase
MTMNKYANFDSGLKISLSPPGVLQVQLDSPDGATLTEGMNEGLTEIWRVADRDEDVRSILVRGNERGFASGTSREHVESLTSDYAYRLKIMRETRELVTNILDCSKPIVSAMNGPVASAGLAVGVLADISIAAKSTVIFDGHVSLFGVAAGDHAAMCWPLLCGMARTKYHLLTGEPLSGEEAASIGLITKCVADDILQSTALDIAEKLARSAPDAVAWTKHTLNYWYRQMMPTFDASLALEFYGIGGPDIAAAVRKSGGYEGREGPAR